MTLRAEPCDDDATLLAPDDPPVFRVERPSGRSPFVLTADHAGRVLPRALGSLGVSDAERARHIAWDIGIAGVATHLSARLDAFAIIATYSRLAIDLNRPPGSPQSIVTVSERTLIPGNVGQGDAHVRSRARALFEPYHARLSAELDTRALADREAVLVTLHSFTPTYMERARPWHAGVLFNRDERLGRVMLGLLRAEEGLVVGENEPYAAHEDTDHTLVTHGERRGLACVELEIRQDLIADVAGQIVWAERLARLLPRAHAQLP